MCGTVPAGDWVRLNSDGCGSLVAGERITVVDDFVTKGNTLLAGASRVAEAFPRATVKAFALIRTLGLQPEIVAIVEPCVGGIRLSGDEAQRTP
jgi:hypothetical protein